MIHWQGNGVAHTLCDPRDMRRTPPNRELWPPAESHTWDAKRDSTTRANNPRLRAWRASVDGCGRLRYQALSALRDTAEAFQLCLAEVRNVGGTTGELQALSSRVGERAFCWPNVESLGQRMRERTGRRRMVMTMEDDIRGGSVYHQRLAGACTTTWRAGLSLQSPAWRTVSSPVHGHANRTEGLTWRTTYLNHHHTSALART